MYDIYDVHMYDVELATNHNNSTYVHSTNMYIVHRTYSYMLGRASSIGTSMDQESGVALASLALRGASLQHMDARS